MSAAPSTGQAEPVASTVWCARETLWERIDRGDLVRTAFVAVCALGAGIASALGAPAPVLFGIAVLGLVVGCWPIVVEAWGDVRHGRMSMELSMLIAIVAAAAIGEWVTALVITMFVLAAEILEELSLHRGRDALTDLMAFLPATVQVRDEAGVQNVPLQKVHPGQTVIISPGGSVPVDGVVVAGRSSIDQSRITGESLPVDVAAEDTVYAGSINQVGGLEVRAERVGTESSYGQIIETVRAAQSSQAPAQRLADRLAAWLVYLALAGAVTTFVLTHDLRATISVVVVAGACGIAAGTPLAVLAAIGRSARSGAFIKGGTHLEQLSAADTVIFDKTGTLTDGVPEVVALQPAPGFEAAGLLRLAATAEWYSEHPLGQAILTQARREGVATAEPESFDYQPGRGLTACVNGQQVRVGNSQLVPEAATIDRTDQTPQAPGATQVHLACGEAYVGTIVFADTVREQAQQCLIDLRRLGYRVLMITGDSHATADRIGTELGIDEVRAELLPDDKHAAIDAERAAGHHVVMVGDGVNDAPALAQADVGIAMGTGTDIARDTADIVLISTDLADLTRAITIARRARRIILANFVGTITIDLIGMVLAAFGVLGPVFAAMVHVGSESAFILNSARLIPHRRGDPRFSAETRPSTASPTRPDWNPAEQGTGTATP